MPEEDILVLKDAIQSLAARLEEVAKSTKSVAEAKQSCRELARDLDVLANGGAAASQSQLLSRRMQRQPANPFLELLPLMTDAENSVLCKGVPPEDTLPLHSMSLNVKDPEGVQTVEIDEAATLLAQRYPQFARGQVLEILHAHTRTVLKPAGDWSIAMSAGSMSALDHAIGMFLNPGDTILMEEYTFLAMVDACMAAGLNLVPVPCDDDGILPSELAPLLPGAKVLYTVPVGHNPLGTRMAPERYQAVYDLCAAHGVTIVEDDAYYYQQHNSNDEKADDDASAVAGLELGMNFVSIDRQGLVFRLDTVSKLLSPGFRLGWVTGPKHFIKAFEDLCYVSSQSGCSMSMICLGKLLAHWKTDGLQAHLKRLQLGLRLRCRSLLRACEAHLQDLAYWSRPQAGMFLWLRMQRPRVFTHEEMLESLQRNKVAPMPGGFCSPVRTGDPVPCFRLSYVTPSDGYDLAAQRLRKVLAELSLPSDAGAAGYS